MKKRLITFLIVLALTVSFITPIFADSSFEDISDPLTENAVEVLRLMGAVAGRGDGKYYPDSNLSRAEFTKIAILALCSDIDLSKYSGITIFPDVTPGHWSFRYVNSASKMGIINGFPDGCFAPNKDITLAEAVTILLRLIGYSDADVGGVWPYGQESLAKTIGMFDGISYSAISGVIKRGDAARLFVNSMVAAAKNDKSGFQLSGKVILKSIDAANKKITVSELGSVATLRAWDNSSLIGKTGYVLSRSGKAIGFIPLAAVNEQSSNAVIIGSSGDTSVLTALAGRSDYSLYKNGCKIDASQLKKNDVVTYDASENRMLVSDTKITIYYNNCEGSPSAPLSITVLNGVHFDLLPSAMSTIAKHKPGQLISLYLTAGGQIAAVGSGSFSGSLNNGVFVVDNYGKADLILGNTVMDLDLNVDKTDLYGKIVKLSGANADEFKFTEVKNNPYGSLNAALTKLGSRKIAANVMVFLNGEQTTLKEIGSGSISYARENADGEIDLIAGYDAYTGNLIAGYGKVTVEPTYDVFDSVDYYLTIKGFGNSDGITKKTNFYEDGFKGYIVANDNGKIFNNAKKLNFVGSIEKSAIVDSKFAYTNLATYDINPKAACYNTDTLQWTSLEDALIYGRTFKLHAAGTSVFVIEYYY